MVSLNTSAMTAYSEMFLSVVSVPLLNVRACCAVKVHTKDTPEKHKSLTLYSCHPQDMLGIMRSGDPMERLVMFRCGVSLRQAGETGTGEGCAGGGGQQNSWRKGCNLHP